MSIRRMIPMGTHQRKCIVCDYPINAKDADLTAHEVECLEKMMEAIRQWEQEPEQEQSAQ